jgi:O-succinylbenzoate synthase
VPQVTEIEAFRLSLPLSRRIGVNRRREHVLLRLVDERGTVGWGEIDPGDDVWDAAESLRIVTAELAPRLLGLDWHRPEELVDPPGPLDPGSSGAVTPWLRCAAGLDIACWDLWCRRHDAPLAHAIGGSRTAVAAGTRVGREATVEALIDRVNQRVRGGYARVTVEIGPGWDVEPIRAVRHAYPGLLVAVNGGGRYPASDDAFAALEAVDGYGLQVIEQPFDAADRAAHAELQRRVSASVGMTLTTLRDIDDAERLGAARALDLRISAAGGVTAARRLHDRAHRNGWAVWCGGGAEFGVARVAAVAVASLAACTLPSDVAGPGQPYSRDIVDPAVRATDGMVPVPIAAPGLGHEVEEDMVRRMSAECVRLPDQPVAAT